MGHPFQFSECKPAGAHRANHTDPYAPKNCKTAHNHETEETLPHTTGFLHNAGGELDSSDDRTGDAQNG